jgi:hypothetical protein
MHLEWRLQTRVAYPYDSDPITLEDFTDDRIYLGVNRARMKVGGHAYRPNFKYYLEYELFGTALLDFRAMYEFSPAFNLKIGQWKAQYSRERIVSSGKQQTVERSILNYAFTIDRQQGISLYGRLKGNGALDFNYWISTFMGTGRGASDSDDDNLMYMTRWQWNPMGEPVGFSGSDLSRHQKFIMSVVVAGVTNESPYTRFSTSGGGQLPGFEDGINGQYRVNQLMFETSGKLRGISWQQELHWKQIEDNVNFTETVMFGNLFQIGYFFNQIFPAFPPKLEVFARHAWYDPDNDVDDNHRSEITSGVNYFINDHRNKVSLEYSYLNFQDDPGQIRDGSRIRLQWDVSF